MPTLDNLSQILQQQGYTTTGQYENGMIGVKDSKGQPGAIPFDYIKQQVANSPNAPDDIKQNINSLRPALNTPDDHSDERDPRVDTGVGYALNAMLEYGNAKPVQAAKKFMDIVGPDNVRINKHGEIVLYNDQQARWNPVDKSIWGMIKSGDVHELGKDLVEMVPSALKAPIATNSALLGATAGAAVLGPIGAVAGGAAGFLGASAIPTIYGKLAGMRDTTPAEDVRDIGMDMLINGSPWAMGKAVGAFKAWRAADAGKALSSIATKGGDAVNDAAAVLAKTSDLAFDQAKRVVGEGERLIPSAKATLSGVKGDAEQAIAQLQNTAVKHTRDAVEAGYDKLHQDYGEKLGELLKSMRGVAVKPTQLVNDAADAIMKRAPGAIVKGENGALEFASNQQAAEAMGSGLTEDAKSALRPILNRINALRFSADSYGQHGANLIMNAEKDLNYFVRNKIPKANDALKADALDLVNGFKESVKGMFDKAGQEASHAYAELKQPYLMYKDGLDALHAAPDTHILQAFSKNTREGAQLGQALEQLGGYSKKAAYFLDKAKDADTTNALVRVFDPTMLTKVAGRPAAAAAVDAGQALLPGMFSKIRAGKSLLRPGLTADAQAVKKIVGVNPSEVLKDPKAGREVRNAVLGFKQAVLQMSMQKGKSMFGEDPQQLQQTLDRALHITHETDMTTEHLLDGVRR